MTERSFVRWLIDIDLVLTNLEHFSNVSIKEQVEQLNEIQQQIEQKLNQLNQIQRSLKTLAQNNLDESIVQLRFDHPFEKYAQQLTALIKRIEYYRINLQVDHRSTTLECLDFDQLLLQISADLRAKQEILQSAVPHTVHLDRFPAQFTYVCLFDQRL